MAVKTVTTQSGKTIKVELVREVQDKVSYADGYNIVVGREIIEYTKILLMDGKKVLAQGKEIGKLYPKVFSTHAEMAQKGAVAQLGNAFIPQSVVDQINVALAELDAENPKSDEQIAIEQAKAEALARWEAEEPLRREHEAFNRRMDDPNSDL